jgi:hypothetical protein
MPAGLGLLEEANVVIGKYQMVVSSRSMLPVTAADGDANVELSKIAVRSTAMPPLGEPRTGAFDAALSLNSTTS